EVSIPADGTCDAPELPAADPTTGCDPSKSSAAGVGSGKSLIAFTHIFDGNIDEPTAAERLTAGCFDVYLADPREVLPGGTGPPPGGRGMGARTAGDGRAALPRGDRARRPRPRRGARRLRPHRLRARGDRQEGPGDRGLPRRRHPRRVVRGPERGRSEGPRLRR